MTWQRKESSNLKIDQARLSNLRKETKLSEENEQSLRTSQRLWDTIKHTDIFEWEFKKVRRERGRQYSWTHITEIFQILCKTQIYTLKKLNKLKRINFKRSIHRHIIKPSKTKRIWNTAREKQLIHTSDAW